MAKRKEKVKTEGEPQGRKRSFLSLGFASLVDRADMQALPTYYTSIGRELAVGRAALGLITSTRSAIQTIATPFWGYLADKHSRKYVLTIGCIIWGVFTLLCAYAGDFNSLLILRLLCGFGLATIIPTGFSLIIDMYKPEARGTWLGLLQMASVIGIALLVPVLGMIDAPSLTFGLEANIRQLLILQLVYPQTVQVVTWLLSIDTLAKYTVYYGAWRKGFVLLAILSFIAAALVFLLVKEPTRGATEKELKDVITQEVAQKYKIDRKSVKEILKTPTMLIIIVQGMLGYIPWIVIQAWFVHWLESVRYISPSEATLLFGLLAIGSALGAALGGFLGDKAEKRSSTKGRIIVAQISVFSGIPLFILILTQEFNLLAYTILAFITALLVTWAGTGAVQPMVANVTKPEVRSTSFSIEQMFEGGFAAIAAVLTGYIADTLNGGIAGITMQSIVPYMGFWLNVLPLPVLFTLFTISGQSLTLAMILTTTIPWIACLLVWFIAYRTYPKDKEKMYQILEERRREITGKPK